MGIEVILSNSAYLENTYDAFEYIHGVEIELSEIIGRKVDLRTPEDLSLCFRKEVVVSAEVQYVQ